MQEWTCPKTGVYRLTAVGASGGGASTSSTLGYGGTTSGEVNIFAGDIIYVYVGQQGSRASDENPETFNGGGKGLTGDESNTCDGSHYNCSSNPNKGTTFKNGSGGGATDFRTVKASDGSWYDNSHTGWNNDTSLKSRIIVAGGGGGLTSSSTTNRDGYATYGNFTNTTSTLGKGESSVNNTGNCGHFLHLYCGGGGGGYYGGQSNYLAPSHGGGGSGYIDYERVSSEKLIQGNNLGNGSASIEYVGPITSTLTLNTGANGSYNGTQGNYNITGEYGTTVIIGTPTRTGYKFRYWTDLADASDTPTRIEANSVYTFGLEDNVWAAHYMLDGDINIEVNGENTIHVDAIDDGIAKYYRFYASMDGGTTFDKVNTNGSSFDESQISQFG